jgi:hypothetical protein
MSDWRKAGIKDELFIKTHEVSKPWTTMTKAQDMEDTWLYENWFYGVTHGIIMESGALNGLLFSTSHMFEHFANWTAIHVGKLCLVQYLYFENCLIHTSRS